jgi:CYTH domain-containing protein
VTAEQAVNRGLDEEMREAKYACIEWERRWLVDKASRPPLGRHAMTLIEDRYIDGSRLRLRRMSQPELGQVKWKLTKKYECADPSARPIVTSYLTEREYEVLRALPARELTKRRYRVPFGGRYCSVDLFEGPLHGLETVECEAEDHTALAALVPPAWAAGEITHVARFQCGSLAYMDAIPE